MLAGNWIPELLTAMGADPVGVKPGVHSESTKLKDIVALDPDGMILMPCGFDLARTAEEATPFLTPEHGGPDAGGADQRDLAGRRQRLFQPPRPAPDHLARDPCRNAASQRVQFRTRRHRLEQAGLELSVRLQLVPVVFPLVPRAVTDWLYVIR